jgi:hypothetical protein
MYSSVDRHNRHIHKELCEFHEQCLCNYVASGLRKNLVFALLGRWAIPVAEIRVGIFLDC